MYSFVEHTVLAEVAELRADQAGCDSGLAALIAQVGKPIVELVDRSKVTMPELYPIGYISAR
ncbi:hypothetical protein SB379_07565 [Burkholderia multivorans]|uniref:hypothetical protein n=1 Tax=Burkholderia multivorans TaxID=87883 RepID=UPI0015E7763C|nr:hypothetical protein [Burkholderia multivorans]MBR8020060.1 hypothetical protein [Burkholderia multivorans]MEB2511468.1 hypothetical protein [Burkholderia multivorans]MEB2521328.1 hypothetical protein [Burkholderia multivorans]MEB2573507.1 hypothetical protein [Burkholderia multivorans]MEB2590667.1 hypothetical protein [Burkholderia multivorans]